jgi:3'(2'), 5'-bisphosphate nucleotidase
MALSDSERLDLAERIGNMTLQAGARILEIYGSDFAVDTKDDRSPVTAADQAAEDIILAELATLTPRFPVVAEESVAKGQIPDIGDGPFWLVDPLDGTREFISRNGEFTVNIALVADTRPVLGAVYAPVLGTLYTGAGPGRAFKQNQAEPRQPIHTRKPAADGLDVVASRSHRDEATDAYLAELTVRNIVSAGSSLKFCLVAEGAADLYPRFGRTMEWDTAAGQAVLEAAGGTVETLDGHPFVYGKADFANPGFVARGSA